MVNAREILTRQRLQSSRPTISDSLRSIRERANRPVNLPKPVGAVVRALQPSNLHKTAVYAGGLGIGGAALAGRGIVQRGSGFARTVFQRALGNPLSGSTLKTYGRNIGGRAIGLLGAFEAFEFQRSRASGTRFDPFPSLGSVASFALNPIAAGVGTLAGFGQRGAQAIQERLPPSTPLPTWAEFPQFPSPTTIFNFPEQFNPSVSPQVGSPLGASAGSFAPSLSVSAGGGGLPPELLLAFLGGAGALGFVAGRRRKKRKKRKKYKRGGR